MAKDRGGGGRKPRKMKLRLVDTAETIGRGIDKNTGNTPKSSKDRKRKR